jgi:hypothetical protein
LSQIFDFFGKGGCLLFWALFMSRPGQISHAISRRWRIYFPCPHDRLIAHHHHLRLTHVTTFHRCWTQIETLNLVTRASPPHHMPSSSLVRISVRQRIARFGQTCRKMSSNFIVLDRNSGPPPYFTVTEAEVCYEHVTQRYCCANLFRLAQQHPRSRISL